MWVYLDGKFIKEDKARVSVLDHGFLYGDGVYDTMRAYGTRVWNMDKHLDRFESSVKLMNLKMPFGRRKLEAAIGQLIKKNGFGESRIRITLTRGNNGFVFGGCVKPTLLIQAVELPAVPEEIYNKGVGVISVKMERILPEAKTISLLPLAVARGKMEKVKAYEALFVDRRGFVREGTVTSVFMVKNGTLLTPGVRVLSGTTAETVMKIAKKEGIKFNIKGFRIDDLYEADEVFVTNTTKKIVPVVKADGKKIGGGKPGAVTKRLMLKFDEYIKKNI